MVHTTSRQADHLPAELVAEMDEMITHYPVSKRSASLPLLHLWQNHFGYIDDSGVEWIAAKLDLQPINILELVTFYPWFRQHAPGNKAVVRICRTLSCALAGSYELREEFLRKVGIDPDKAPEDGHIVTSPDGRFSVEFVECLASCGTAPVCLVNDDLHENVTKEQVPSVLQQYA